MRLPVDERWLSTRKPTLRSEELSVIEFIKTHWLLFLTNFTYNHHRHNFCDACKYFDAAYFVAIGLFHSEETGESYKEPCFTSIYAPTEKMCAVQSF